jgi:hypothetical protein
MLMTAVGLDRSESFLLPVFLAGNVALAQSIQGAATDRERTWGRRAPCAAGAWHGRGQVCYAS